MAEVISDVDTGGAGAYATVALWLAGIAGDQGTNTPVAECRSSDGSADTSQITLSTAITNYTQVILRPKSATEHPGYYSTSSYHNEWTPTGTNQNQINAQIPNILIQRLQFKNDSSTYGSISYIGEADGQYVEQCIFYRLGASIGLYAYTTSPDAQYWFNNVLYGDGTAGGIGMWARYSNNYIYNNTVIGFDTNIQSNASSSSVAINNIAQDGVTADYTTGFSGSSTNNLAGDTTAPGTNPVQATLTFLDKTNHKYALVSSDTAAIDSGYDLSATFTVDNIGTTRPQNSVFDIGAFELVSGVSTVINYSPLVLDGLLFDETLVVAMSELGYPPQKFIDLHRMGFIVDETLIEALIDLYGINPSVFKINQNGLLPDETLVSILNRLAGKS